MKNRNWQRERQRAKNTKAHAEAERLAKQQAEGIADWTVDDWAEFERRHAPPSWRRFRMQRAASINDEAPARCSALGASNTPRS